MSKNKILILASLILATLTPPSLAGVGLSKPGAQKNLDNQHARPVEPQRLFELASCSDVSVDKAEIYKMLDLQKINENSIAIFDVDGTAIPENCFIPKPRPTPPVLELYNYLKSRGVKIVFLTARVDFFDSLDSTDLQLNNAGFTGFMKIVGMSFEKKEEISAKEKQTPVTVLNAEWKAEQRESLAQTYEIIATVDDVALNLHGKNTGIKIWVH